MVGKAYIKILKYTIKLYILATKVLTWQAQGWVVGKMQLENFMSFNYFLEKQIVFGGELTWKREINQK